MLPDFLDPKQLSIAQSETSRRKKAREMFAEMYAGTGGFMTQRMLSWFQENNTPALADVLDDLTSDEIAEWIIELLKVAQS